MREEECAEREDEAANPDRHRGRGPVARLDTLGERPNEQQQDERRQHVAP